jgi:hypothetical protein
MPYIAGVHAVHGVLSPSHTTDLPALAVLRTNVLQEGTVLGLLLCCGVLLEELLQA